MTNKFTQQLLVILFVVTLISGCNSVAPAVLAPQAIENYLNALINKDLNRMVDSSCAAWEADARQELRTFDAVVVTLEDLICAEIGVDGDTSLVSCQGKIVANYGNEVLEIDLSDRVYQVINQNSGWRMCGYR